MWSTGQRHSRKNLVKTKHGGRLKKTKIIKTKGVITNYFKPMDKKLPWDFVADLKESS